AGPADGQPVRLEGEGAFYDLVLASGGGNAVVVYRGTGFDADGRPTYAPPVTFPVGTNPVSVTAQDLNGDGVPDLLVANEGSNDVSVLFGAYDAAGHWTAVNGPRLASGGVGPDATALRDLTGPAG